MEIPNGSMYSNSLEPGTSRNKARSHEEIKYRSGKSSNCNQLGQEVCDERRASARKEQRFRGKKGGTSEDKTLEADALLHRALAQESLVYAHSLSAQKLQQFIPFDLPNALKEGYESLDMARDAIALAAARSPHMREEFVFFDHEYTCHYMAR
ncbi:hypothetical protein MY10362_000326 [Beauveria mimosiformis]